MSGSMAKLMSRPRPRSISADFSVLLYSSGFPPITISGLFDNFDFSGGRISCNMGYGTQIGNNNTTEKQLRQCWRTPKSIFNDLHKVCKFTIDACADASNALLPRYWDESQDCRRQNWQGERVFCNPPFGLTAEIITKCREAEFAVFLLPVTSLTSRYVEKHSPDAIICPGYRVEYDPPVGLSVRSRPTLGSVYLVYGDITGMSFDKLGTTFRV